MKSRSIAGIVRNMGFIMSREEVFGFTKEQCLGLFTSLSIIIEGYMVNFMRRSYIDCMGSGSGHVKLI